MYNPNDPSLLDEGILILDDEGANVRLLEKTLRLEGYRNLAGIQDSRLAIGLIRERQPALMLLDLNMPYLDGFEVMESLKALDFPAQPAILVLTAQNDREHRIRALATGARDFLTKPFDRQELLARVRNLLEVERYKRLMHDQNQWLEQKVKERTEQIFATQLQIVRRLGRAAEYRDNETGYHIIRMSQTSALLGRAVGLSRDACELILHASPMHDIGKIGIPDRILLKPGNLEPDEWEIMKTHTLIGADILDGDDSELLSLARLIALTHHEKWDGSGYPQGLKGEEIPLAGRIVALADVFDALTSERPYKKAWAVDQAVNHVRGESGTHFDPDLVTAFLALLPEILEIRDRYAEP
jgi:putative two-component system response regulator